MSLALINTGIFWAYFILKAHCMPAARATREVPQVRVVKFDFLAGGE